MLKMREILCLSCLAKFSDLALLGICFGYIEPESLGWILKSSSPCGGFMEGCTVMASIIIGVLSRVSKTTEREVELWLGKALAAWRG